MKAKEKRRSNRVASNNGLGSRANKNTKTWANRFGECKQWACYYKAVGKHGYCAKHAEYHRYGEEA